MSNLVCKDTSNGIVERAIIGAVLGGAAGLILAGPVGAATGAKTGAAICSGGC